MTTLPQGPLTGIRVVELSHMVMGPTAGLVLADLGADVIKIEPVDGDRTRLLKGSGAGYFPMYNRNKSSLCLNIKLPEGRAVLLRLLQDADVLLENFRTGTMDKLGLGYKDLSRQFKRLVYCSLKGFLPGPYEHRTALDEVAQMMGGLAYMTGPTGRPLRAGASVIDVMGGSFGALAVLAALRERDQTGSGQYISSGLFETTAFLVGQHMAQEVVLGEPAPPMPERVSAWAIYDTFITRDELPLFVAVVSDPQWVTFCKAFGLDDFAADEQLKLNNDRVTQRPRIMARIKPLFAGFKRDDLVEKLEKIGLPFAPVATPGDLFDDPHLNQSEGLVAVQLADGTRTRLPALPVRMNERRFGLRQNLPRPGGQSRRLLEQHGYSADEIQALIDAKVIAADG